MAAVQQQSIGALLQTLRDRQVRLWLDGDQLRFQAPKGAIDADLGARLAAQKPQLMTALAALSDPVERPTQVPDPTNRTQPFPLTELQQAYWVGEVGGYAQSAIPCYVHHVALPALPIAAVRQALISLQRRHDVLRTRVFADATQVFAPHEDAFCPVHQEDFTALAPDTAEHRLRKMLHSFPEHHLPPLDQGPPLAAALVKMPDGSRLILALRLIVLDGPSIARLFHELLALLFEQPLPQAASTLSYRDYVLALTDLPRDTAQAFWDRTIPTLPGPPDLPTVKQMSRKSQFVRLARTISPADWDRLKTRAQAHALTPNAVMLALYAAVLRSWARSPGFTLNVLTNYRPFDHPEAHLVVGNHSNTVLTTCVGEGDFIAQARAVQANLAERLPHAALPGVAVMRRFQQTGEPNRPAAPFVFTSGISKDAADALPKSLQSMFRTVESHLRTPQVWLDHQVVETHEGLLCYWDYVKGVFEPGLPELLFERFNACVAALLNEEAAWHRADPAPVAEATLPTLVPGPTPAPEETLGRVFLERAKDCADKPAIIAADGTLVSYAQLVTRAGRIAAGLRATQAVPGDLVAVHLPKSVDQITAVIGISLAGMAWLPLDPGLPAARIDAILRQSQAVLTIGLATGEGRMMLQDLSTHSPVSQDHTPGGDDLAYVIYTSGSTGEPKGVAVSHTAVLNTIHDVNRRFSIDESDRVLALSALSFDLSVYDIWGMLAVGGTIVVPQQSDLPDPVAILAQCARDGVTVWNSVPAFLEMAFLASASEVRQALSTFRVVMLSGDWIPLGLADQIATSLPDASFYSLGGATEAAIWSNYYPITGIDPAWTSIPYGRALSGQQLHVLDTTCAVCPPLVTGQIYIEGLGLADGYYRDPERTEASFIIHPTGRRLYATGDLGRTHCDGTLEFLGRSDFQLKLRGFRIEAGDVEAVLMGDAGVDQATVLTARDTLGQDRLIACCTGMDVDPVRLTERATAALPSYMVPSVILALDRLPLSANGKRDRKALGILAQDALIAQPTASLDEKGLILPAKLVPLWARFTGSTPQDPEDSFFQSGGTSMQAVRFVQAIKAEFGVELSLAVLFENPSIGAVWQRITEHTQSEAP